MPHANEAEVIFFYESYMHLWVGYTYTIGGKKIRSKECGILCGKRAKDEFFIEFPIGIH